MPTVTRHEARAARNTQRARILELLIRSRNWVPLPRLVQIAAQYSARVHELRRLGFNIENKTRVVDGQRHSWFRLRTGQRSTLSVASSGETSGARVQKQTLFDLAPFERHRDDG